MNTATKIRSIAAAVAVIVATAGCASLNESAEYRFEIVGQPATSSAGTTFTVRMLKASNGQRVTNAEIFVTHPEFAISPKAVPWVRYERIALKPDGQGDYLYQGANIRGSETLSLSARVPGVNESIIGTLVTRSTNSTPG